jgi:hypothetical protein
MDAHNSARGCIKLFIHIYTLLYRITLLAYTHIMQNRVIRLTYAVMIGSLVFREFWLNGVVVRREPRACR